MRQLLPLLCLVSLASSRHVARRPDGSVYSTRTMERVWRVLGEFPVVDGHNDFPMAIRDLFHNDIQSVNFDHDLTQVDLQNVNISNLGYSVKISNFRFKFYRLIKLLISTVKEASR